MREHTWRLLVATENYDYGGLDFLHWCENCGSVKKVPGRVDKATVFFLPGKDRKPNSQECVDEVPHIKFEKPT